MLNRFALLALIALFLTGCAQEFPTPGPDWKTFVGQLQYSTPKRSIIGDVVVRSSGPDFQLDFVTGPGFPLMSLRQDATHRSARGILARGNTANWFQLRERFDALAPGADSMEAGFAGERFRFRFR